MTDKQQPAEPVLQPAPELEVRSFPFIVEEVRDAENGRTSDFTIRGHAAVYDKWSHDLGGFREKIAKGAFDNVLAGDPHVLHLIDHDTRYVLSSTRNKTLELRSDPAGLHMWSKVAPTSYAADLRVLMERKDVDQSSFAFTVARDEWTITGEGNDEKVERTIHEVGELFDVTTTAMGAYPQTDSQVALATRVRAKAFAEALPEPPAESSGPHPDEVAPEEERTTAPDDPAAGDSPHLEEVAEEKRAEVLHALKAHSRTTLELTKRRLLDAENERNR